MFFPTVKTEKEMPIVLYPKKNWLGAKHVPGPLGIRGWGRGGKEHSHGTKRYQTKRLQSRSCLINNTSHYPGETSENINYLDFKQKRLKYSKWHVPSGPRCPLSSAAAAPPSKAQGLRGGNRGFWAPFKYSCIWTLIISPYFLILRTNL